MGQWGVRNPALFCPSALGDSCNLSPLFSPHPSLGFPKLELVSRAHPDCYSLGSWPGSRLAGPQTQSCKRPAQPQPPAARWGSSRAGQKGTGSRGHGLPRLPHLRAKASPAGVKLIRRACGERVRPPSPRGFSPLPQPWPGLTDLCFLSPTPTHSAYGLGLHRSMRTSCAGLHLPAVFMAPVYVHVCV